MERCVIAAIPGGGGRCGGVGRVEGVGGDGGLWGLPESAFLQDSRHQPATGIRSG
jgi:hypothetical protein